MIVKRCSRCRQMLPAENFHPNSRMKTGLNSWCKTCALERTREWRAANPDYVEAVNAARRLAACGDERGVRVAGVMRRCVECDQEFRAFRSTAMLCSRKCKDARYRRLHPERYKAYTDNKNHSRRARSQASSAGPRLTTSDVKMLLAAAKTCPLCRRRLKPEDDRRPELDHIRPLNVGGTHTLGNVRVICRRCNGSRPKDGSDVDQEVLWARS